MKLNVLCLLTLTHLLKLYCLVMKFLSLPYSFGVDDRTSLVKSTTEIDANILALLPKGEKWEDNIVNNDNYFFLKEIGYLPKLLSFSFRSKEAIWNLYQKWSRNEQVCLVSQKSSMHIKINMAFLKLKQFNIALAKRRSLVRFSWNA